MRVNIIRVVAILGAVFAASSGALALAQDNISKAPATVTTPSAAEIVRVLSDEDIARYKDIFDVQEAGRWSAADRKIADLENDILLGYVLHQRYMHPTAYRSRFGELKKWMAYYADHPEVSKEIYRLARKRQPRKVSSPVRPVPRKWRNPESAEQHPLIVADYAKTSRPRLRQIEGRVRYLTRKKQAMAALKYLDQPRQRRAITERQHDRMRSWVAASLYYQGYVAKADELASETAIRNGETAVLAHWIAGLIDFRDGRLGDAHNHFSAMAKVSHQDDALRAAAGFWAARSALNDGHFEDVAPNLEIAASFPFTFYGQLALAQLGRDFEHDWSAPVLTEQGWSKLVAATPAVQRSAALAQVGKIVEAELELRWANGVIEPHLDYDLLATATGLKLPAAQIEIALAGDASYLQAGLYPIPDYAPRNGFETDRALLYALMRQESKFKTEATSRVGARGLMQLMPRTASFIGKDRSLRQRRGRDRLYDPALNLQLGQTYVNHLIDTSANGDLFHMAVAYNGGPGNLRRWKRATEIEDSLLFIESIPNSESRDFVEKVLTNVWVYRARLGQPAPSREKVAAGELPLYEALDQLTSETR